METSSEIARLRMRLMVARKDLRRDIAKALKMAEAEPLKSERRAWYRGRASMAKLVLHLMEIEKRACAEHSKLLTIQERRIRQLETILKRKAGCS